jgi:hypothetical protein
LGLAALFVMTGATSNTDWLGTCVQLDPKGFVQTGGACPARMWDLRLRPPCQDSSPSAKSVRVPRDPSPHPQARALSSSLQFTAILRTYIKMSGGRSSTLRRCEHERRAAKTSHGNDGVWKAWKALKPASHSSHTLEIPSGVPHSHGFGGD